MNNYIDEIYDSLMGFSVKEAAVPWVENIFAPGSYCDREYARVYDAYARLRDRLNAVDEDADVECMINALLNMQQAVGRAMFECGRQYERMDHE